MGGSEERIRERFDAFSETILPRLRQYLLHRFRPLIADHEDLIQDTLTDLYVYVERRPNSMVEGKDLNALAYTILKRRCADHYRRQTRRAVAELEVEPFAESDNVERSVRYRQLLSAVILLLTDLNEDDQQLLLREQLFPGDKLEALSTSERKRLSRLRELFRKRLKARFGLDPNEYLIG